MSPQKAPAPQKPSPRGQEGPRCHPDPTLGRCHSSVPGRGRAPPTAACHPALPGRAPGSKGRTDGAISAPRTLSPSGRAPGDRRNGSTAAHPSLHRAPSWPCAPTAPSSPWPTCLSARSPLSGTSGTHVLATSLGLSPQPPFSSGPSVGPRSFLGSLTAAHTPLSLESPSQDSGAQTPASGDPLVRSGPSVPGADT